MRSLLSKAGTCNGMSKEVIPLQEDDPCIALDEVLNDAFLVRPAPSWRLAVHPRKSNSLL